MPDASSLTRPERSYARRSFRHGVFHGEDVMAVPGEAPAEVHAFWAKIPNCADIYLLFRPFRFGPKVRVKCEGWGQLANDDAASRQAMYHIKNKRPMWWGKVRRLGRNRRKSSWRRARRF